MDHCRLPALWSQTSLFTRGYFPRSTLTRALGETLAGHKSAVKGASEAHYALDNLSNKILAAEYQTVLPDEGH